MDSSIIQDIIYITQNISKLTNEQRQTVVTFISYNVELASLQQQHAANSTNKVAMHKVTNPWTNKDVLLTDVQYEMCKECGEQMYFR